MLRRPAFFLSAILMLFVLVPLKTLACSGYPYFGVDDLPETELLVRATVIDADDRGYSAVIRVEEYYKGEGPKLLTVARYNVGLQTGRGVRGYDTGCLYSGRGHEWRPGSTGYFGLNRNYFETYSDYHSGSAHFYVWDGQITYQEGATEGYALEWDAPKTISEEDFIAKMLEAGGREAPVPPTIDGVLRYPLMRYLMITTENGTRYQVNPDRSVTPVDAETAIAISPDDAHVVIRADEETLGFYYVWPLGYTPEHIKQTVKVPGRDLLFSNDSHMVAVWDNSQLSVHLFRNEGRGNHGDWGTGMQLDLIASTTLAIADGGSAVVQWSADNSTIAWQDDNGIWRWDLYEDAVPDLVTAAVNIENAKLLDLSASGRYVRYGTATGWTLFDSDGGETYANALASPGDRHLIFVNSETTPINNWRESKQCTPPLRRNCAMYFEFPNAETITVFPYQMELLGLVSCGSACYVAGASWHPAINSGNTGYVGGRYIGTYMADLRQIAYDPVYDQPAVLRGDYQIEFEFYHSGYFDGSYDSVDTARLDYLDLEEVVDSPILSIEWGQPVFYDSFMLTATEYLPRTITIESDGSALQQDIRDGRT
ncbi:MAG: hypothetical protein OXG60_11285 [Chloroflexi bacterium]|nr:hypothetical protein [Chloroflexota bacterium]